MKTKLQLLVASLLISAFSFGQRATPGHAKFNSNMNNYKTQYYTDNDMFWDFTSNTTKTFIPKNSNSSPIFGASCWMGGYANVSDLRVAAMTYRQNGVDFWPGPIDTTTVVSDSLLCHSFDTFFPIYKTQVDSQKNHLYTSSTIPQQILNWPANGIASYHTSYKLAPYQDVNHNNTYDPLNGDYPIMRGDYSIYQITNDVGNLHSETGSLHIMGIETHDYQYIVDCPSDSALWNTMFTHYELINRSPNTYTNFYFTMWLDFDLGYYGDDYIGCDTTSNLFYVYNGDGYDEDYGGLTGYHQYLPAFGGMFLNQKMSVFTAYNNTAAPLNGNPGTFNGTGYVGYYNLMKGYWETGNQPMTYGNYGLTAPSATCTPTSFLFSGDPVANTGWIEASVGGDHPGDRKGQGSCGPYTFNPGDTIKIDFAYIFARDYTHPRDSVASIPLLKQYAQSIQNYYNSNNTPCGSTFTTGLKQHTANNEQVNIYPNPSTGNFVLETNNETKQTLQVYDINGKVVLTQTIFGKATIDASNLSQGVYNLSIISNEGVVNKRVVIVR